MSSENSKPLIEVKEGVVGFFDILGFKSYIENDPDVASKSALEVILKIKTEAPKIIKDRFTKDKILDDIEWSVLSDTIVLSLPYPDSSTNLTSEASLVEKRVRWLALLYSSAALLDYMFDQGLPIRGAISFGKYFVNQQSLAGNSIVEAMKLAQRLNLSAIAISSHGDDELRKIMNPTSYWKKMGKAPVFFPYLVPLKEEASEKMFVVNQWTLHDKYDNHDIPQLVAQSFWKHGKDIDGPAYQKFQNTEMLLRYVVAMKREWKA